MICIAIYRGMVHSYHDSSSNWQIHGKTMVCVWGGGGGGGGGAGGGESLCATSFLSIMFANSIIFFFGTLRVKHNQLQTL